MAGWRVSESVVKEGQLGGKGGDSVVKEG